MKVKKLLIILIAAIVIMLQTVSVSAFFQGSEGIQGETIQDSFYNAGMSKVGSGISKTGNEYVNLASPKRTQHILYGDETGGGHLWPGKPGKSVFPEKWSADKAMHEISDIVTDPSLTWQKNRVIKGVQRYEVIGTRDGVSIKVITDGKDVITAFPVK